MVNAYLVTVVSEIGTKYRELVNAWETAKANLEKAYQQYYEVLPSVPG